MKPFGNDWIVREGYVKYGRIYNVLSQTFLDADSVEHFQKKMIQFAKVRVQDGNGELREIYESPVLVVEWLHHDLVRIDWWFMRRLDVIICYSDGIYPYDIGDVYSDQNVIEPNTVEVRWFASPVSPQ